MWEHRAVSHKQFKESGRITPTETYVQLMDKVEDAVKEAQKMPFDHEEFLKYIPQHGPWEGGRQTLLRDIMETVGQLGVGIVWLLVWGGGPGSVSVVFDCWWALFGNRAAGKRPIEGHIVY